MFDESEAYFISLEMEADKRQDRWKSRVRCGDPRDPDWEGHQLTDEELEEIYNEA